MHWFVRNVLTICSVLFVCVYVCMCMYVCMCVYAVLELILLKSNPLQHIIIYFEETLCITVTYYLEIKVTNNILY